MITVNPDEVTTQIELFNLHITEDDITEYVLSGFTPEEKKIIANTILVVTEAALSLITEGLVAAMNKYN